MVKATNQEQIRIVLVEDDETIRTGYAYLLSKQPEFIIVNSYASAEGALRNLEQDAADVFLLDISLTGMSGIDAIDTIKEKRPHSCIIMLTAYEDPELIFKALSKGASGYLTKNSTTSKKIEAIKEVVKGGGPMSPNIARLVISSFQKNKNSPLSK